MNDQSLRGFLELVKKKSPENFVVISDPVKRELDITSSVFELEKMGRSPILFFENVSGYELPVVTNVSGNRYLLALAMGTEPDQLPMSYRERCQSYIPAEIVETAPWQEVVIEGDDLDLNCLPIPLHFEVDSAPYITAGQITARDPETGIDTIGFHRLMLKGKNRLGLSLHSRRRMFEFHRRAESRGEPLPAAITIGVHPIHYMGSMAYHYPPNIRKYDIICALF
ncbi:MAG: UbiD family decarboxylase domain-containing protein [Alphaproteobacteria bacterium]